MFRLSPAEVNELCFQENLKQRKLRLLQVREQAKTFSADTREKYRKEKRKQINALKRRIIKESEQEKENDLKILESVYESQLEKFGESHRAAQNQPDIEQLKEKKEKHQEAVAISRGKEALSALRKEAALKNTEAKKHLEARQQALEVEKQRAAWISRLDLPTLDQVDQVLLNTDSITATQDTPNNGQQKLPHVEKEKWDTQRDARVAAMEENMKIERNAEMRQEVDEENAKKAKARFNVAFEDEMFDKGYAKIIEHLDFTEKQEWAKNKQDYGKVKKPPVIEDSKQKEFQNKEEELECIVEKIFNGMEEYRGRNVQKVHVGGHSNEEEQLDDDNSQASPKQEEFSANRALKSSNGGLTQLLTRIRQQREDLARQHMDYLDKQHWPRIDHEETRPFKVSSPFLDKIDTDQVSETEYINIPGFDVTKTLKTEQPFVKTKKDDKLIVDPTHHTVNSNDLVEETQPTKFKTKVLHFPPVDIESNKQTTKTEVPGLQDQTVTVKRKVKSFKKHDDIPVPLVSVEPTIASVEFPEKIAPTFQSVGEKPEEGQQKMNYDNIPPIQTTTTTSSESGLQVKSSHEILLTQKMKHKKTKIFSGKTESPVGSETSYMSLPEGYGMSDFNLKEIPDNIFEQKVHSKEQLPTSEERISIIKSKSDSSEKKVVFGSLQDTSDSNRLSESHEKIQIDSGKPFIYKERLFPSLGDPDSIVNLKKEYIRKLASKYFSIPTDFRDGTGDPRDSEDHEKETPTHHRFPSPQRTDGTSSISISSTNTTEYSTSPTAYTDRKLEEKGDLDTIPETVNTYFCTSDSNEYTAAVVSKEDNKQMSKVKHLNIERVNTLSVSQETGYSSLFDITTSTACELSDKSISPLISESKPSAVGKMQKISQQEIELLSTDSSVPDDQTETTDSVVVTSAPTLSKDIEIYSQTNREGSESNEIGILECLDALARSSLLDATYQRQRPPPTISRVPLGENLVLHELSTILEVDTPSSSYIKLSPEKYSSVFFIWFPRLLIYFHLRDRTFRFNFSGSRQS
ncbi:uncharacterized protein LOC143237185 [Tachypleus tridentatus]|uniref:uncharacterized protein LOC143237185 n=1 Tax=Tachypleus tridentatus TaxID=6853 RepID=UPI003FD6B3E7